MHLRVFGTLYNGREGVTSGNVYSIALYKKHLQGMWGNRQTSLELGYLSVIHLDNASPPFGQQLSE